MKKQILIVSIEIFLGVLAPFSGATLREPTRGAQGGVTSNGGDSIAAEFSKIGRQIVEILRTHTGFPVTADEFSLAVSKTWVVSKRRTFLRGQEMEALNYPTERRIEVNRNRWLANKDEIRQRYVLVAHEYFGILGMDDDRYQISEKLFTIPGVALNSIRCKAFTDGAISFDKEGGEPFLELTTYQGQSIALLKRANGTVISLSPLAIGETMITGAIKEDLGDSITAIISINLGFGLRMVQVQIKKNYHGKLIAKSWDIKADAQISAVTNIVCEQMNW